MKTEKIIEYKIFLSEEELSAIAKSMYVGLLDRKEDPEIKLTKKEEYSALEILADILESLPEDPKIKEMKETVYANMQIY